MATRPAKAAAATNKASAASNSKNTLTTKDHNDKPKERIIAELGLSSIVPNVNTARTYAKATFGEIDLTESIAVVREIASAVQASNFANPEATLAAQAVALNAIFNEMARRAAANMGEYLNATEIYLRLGLKAQAQCRATLQTLFEMKNPQPLAFVKQANIANGPQQVNNAVPSGPVPPTLARAENSADPTNEVLGVRHDQRLDRGATGATISADRQLETMGARDRAKD